MNMSAARREAALSSFTGSGGHCSGLSSPCAHVAATLQHHGVELTIHLSSLNSVHGQLAPTFRIEGIICYRDCSRLKAPPLPHPAIGSGHVSLKVGFWSVATEEILVAATFQGFF